MKNLGRAIVLIALSLAPAARAQDALGIPNNLIDVNPLSLLWGELSLEYERSLGTAASIVIGPQALLFKGPVNTSSAGITPHGAGLSLSFHFFPAAQALHGFWVGPQVDADWATATVGSITVQGTEFSVFGIVGYTFLPSPHFALSLGIGGGLRLNGLTSTDSSGNTVIAFQKGFVPTGRAAIGYAF